MSKRNTIFRNIHTHLKNEHNMEDEPARVLAKQALSDFRSSGSKAIMRTSNECCGKEHTETCDSNNIGPFRTIEGECNNIDKPLLGAFETNFIREVKLVGSNDAKKDITTFDPKKSK